LLRAGLPLLGVLLLMLYPAHFTVSGTALLEPVSYMTVATEVPGRINQVQVQLGDEVAKGAPLLQLDSRELELQLQQAEQEYQRYRVQADSALAFHEEAQAQLSRLYVARSAVAVERLRADVARTHVQAPINGIVIGPQNLSTRNGEYVRTGENLLLMADPSSWRVRIQLREQDQTVLTETLQKAGTIEVEVRFNAEPTRTYRTALTKDEQIFKGLDLGGGKYGFAVSLPFAPSEKLAHQFRVGFTGRASFEIKRAPLAYIFFRDFVHFFRMQF
jgi:multidrug resistance efflux pump